LKLLLTSVDALVNSATGRSFPGIKKQLDYYLSLDPGNRVVVMSVRSAGLQNIPKEYNPLLVPFRLRGSGVELLVFIAAKTGFSIDQTIVLGSKDHDMYTAAHTNSILLTAVYSQSNNAGAVIFIKQYGVPLNNVASLGKFFERFYGLSQPWYFRVEVDPVTTLYALTNANTFGIKGTPEEELKRKFLDCLKNDNATHLVAFSSYFLVSCHLLEEFRDIDIWDIYPSSSKERVNEDLLYFARMAAHSFKKTFPKHRLLIRKAPASKRHFKNPALRVDHGCKEELETMIINPAYNGKLAGKSVAIIDDFTRFGTSCETARILLREAGVRKVVFIAMGKFGGDNQYHAYEYSIAGNIHTSVRATKVSHTVINGTLNRHSNLEFLESFRDL
jgi:hypothetical protein